MPLPRPKSFALAVCLSLLLAMLVRANDQPAGIPVYPDSAEWLPAPEPYVPGPGWFAEEPGTVYPPTPPPHDNWNVAYPFKYYPQGNMTSDESYYDPSLLPAGIIDESFFTPPPCYLGTFYFDVVALNRHSNLESTDVIFDSALAPLVSTSDLNLDMEAGIRLGLLLPGVTGNDWIFEYFGINAFQDNITRSDPFLVSDVFFGVRGFASTLTMQYESKLDSLEFMIRSRQTQRLAPMAGIRYVRVGEQLNDVIDGSGTNGWFSHTDNDLFGFQFGCQGLICELGRWRMETTVKAGPYYNDIDVDILAQNAAGGVINKHVNHSQTAFIGDWKIGLVCRLGPRMNFRMGYQGLWIEGLAMGPNQVNNISFATGLETVDVSGAIYQGGYLGLDLSW